MIGNIIFQVAKGFIGPKKSYWRSGWDVLDGGVVITSWIGFPFDIGVCVMRCVDDVINADIYIYIYIYIYI